MVKQRDFALLWFGGLISMMGDWAMFAALPFYAYEQTNSAFASGAVLTALTLPGLLFGTVAGVFVDRWTRKRTMVVANLLQVLVMLPLLLVRSGESLWLIYVVAFVMASVWQFISPAENALLPSLVGTDRLMVANSLNAFNDNLARIAGPVLGGLVVAFAGLGGVALLNAATFLLAAGLIAAMRTSGPARKTEDTAPGGLLSVFRERLQGLELVAGDRRVAALFVILGAAMLADSILSALIAPFVIRCTEREHAQYSLLRHAGRGADCRTGIGMICRLQGGLGGAAQALYLPSRPYPSTAARRADARPEHVPSALGSQTRVGCKGRGILRRLSPAALRQGWPGRSGGRGHNVVT